MKESGKQKLELLRRRFGEWLAACNYAVRTREEYERSVRDFIEWLAKETEIEGINEALPQHLHQYQMALCQRPAKEGGGILSVSTQAKRLAAIKTWFEWMAGELLLEATPIEEPRDVRDRAMLEVLYGSGIRREETLALTIYDADLATGSLRIELGKGRQTRIVPLTQSA